MGSPQAPAHAGQRAAEAREGSVQPDVRLIELRKDFGQVSAVDGISLDIARGEFFSLLGPSGCGKTTTLRMIGGFEQPDSGWIQLAGVDVAGLAPHKRDVNTVFQSYALFPHLDVAGNISYGLRRKRVTSDEIRARVGKILSLVELPGLESRRTSQLSGGQQQRVALARALVNEPRVLLLDEPLGALDLKLRKQMQLFLKGLQQELRTTFVYVTHDQEEAMTMSDRLAVMRGGRIEQVGPPQEVYEHPATEYVAGFLGASNLLEGEAGGTADGLREVRLTSGEQVRVPAGPELQGRVKLGVRPEKIRIAAGVATAGPRDNIVEGTVVDATFVGVSHVYTVETKAGSRMTVYAQNLGISTDRAPRQGDDVRLAWHPEHTFVVETGAR